VKKKSSSLPPAGDNMFAMSVQRFCAAHGISKAFFYKLRAEGRGPTEMKVGTRTLISVEAAADWRAEREAATTSGSEA